MNTIAVEVARAALMEVGHPELAASVVPNRVGNPKITTDDWDRDPEGCRPWREVIVRAFCLGHLAAGHACRVVTDPDDGLPALWCDCVDHAALIDPYEPSDSGGTKSIQEETNGP